MEASQRIIDGIELAQSLEQPHLLVEPLGPEHLHHLGSRALRAHYGHVGLDDAPHLGANLVGGLPRQVDAAHGAVVSARHGIPYPQACPGIQAVYGQIEHETQRAHIAARPRGGCHRQEFYLFWRVERKRQVFVFIIDACAHGRESERFGQQAHERAHGGATLDIERGRKIGDSYLHILRCVMDCGYSLVLVITCCKYNILYHINRDN